MMRLLSSVSSSSSLSRVVGYSRCILILLLQLSLFASSPRLLVAGFGLDAMLSPMLMIDPHHHEVIMSVTTAMTSSNSAAAASSLGSTMQYANTVMDNSCPTSLSVALSSSSSSSLLSTGADFSASSSSSSSVPPMEAVYASYKYALATRPLITKMMTGAVLAVAGDGIAQRCIGDSCPLGYDVKRATAFCLFDVSYRAVQHYLYPPLIQQFHGQYVLAAVSSIGCLLQGVDGGSISLDSAAVHADSSMSSLPLLAGAMEQALVSQLAIIPTLYYPVFFIVTGAVQGLSIEQTIARAKETFIPLMKRNLLFWIPVQFLVFGFVPEPLQISVLIVFGLIWTIILSVVAGSVSAAAAAAASAPDNKSLVNVIDNDVDMELEVVMAMPSEQQQQQQSRLLQQEELDMYCVTGMEPNCHIDPDNLFRPPVHQKEQQPATHLQVVVAATAVVVED